LDVRAEARTYLRGSQSFQRSAALAFLGRKEAVKGEGGGALAFRSSRAGGIGREQPAGDQGGECGVGAGDGEYGDAGGDSGGGDLRARVGDSGCSSVGHNGDARTALESCDQFFGAGSFIVLVVADGRRFDLEMVEEFLRLAGVLTGDAVCGAQHPQRPQGDVFKIADGGGDEIEAGGEWLVWLIVVRHISSIIPYSSQEDRAGLYLQLGFDPRPPRRLAIRRLCPGGRASAVRQVLRGAACGPSQRHR